MTLTANNNTYACFILAAILLIPLYFASIYCRRPLWTTRAIQYSRIEAYKRDVTLRKDKEKDKQRGAPVDQIVGTRGYSEQDAEYERLTASRRGSERNSLSGPLDSNAPGSRASIATTSKPKLRRASLSADNAPKPVNASQRFSGSPTRPLSTAIKEAPSAYNDNIPE